jgi:hypothetical protein
MQPKFRQRHRAGCHYVTTPGVHTTPGVAFPFSSETMGSKVNVSDINQCRVIRVIHDRLRLELAISIGSVAMSHDSAVDEGRCSVSG